MIQLEHISKSFGNQQVLDDITFEVNAGEKLCVIGKSGSGKSVMMKLMVGLLKADRGTVRMAGVEMGSASEEAKTELLHRVGVVFQGAALFDSLDVYENVGIRLIEDGKLSASEIRSRSISALEKVGLTADILKKFPAELSGGMRKRVGVARAIIHQPQFLFFDEPTTGLDPVNSDRIDDLIEQLSEEEGRTSIIITHDLATVRRVATKVAMVHETHLGFFGTPEDLYASDAKHVREFLLRSGG